MSTIQAPFSPSSSGIWLLCVRIGLAQKVCSQAAFHEQYLPKPADRSFPIRTSTMWCSKSKTHSYSMELSMSWLNRGSPCCRFRTVPTMSAFQHGPHSGWFETVSEISMSTTPATSRNTVPLAYLTNRPMMLKSLRQCVGHATRAPFLMSSIYHICSKFAS